jgi:hypothetical protein
VRISFNQPPHREAALNQTGQKPKEEPAMETLSQKVEPNAMEVEPITTGESSWGYLSFFLADDEGCKVRFGIEQKFYALPATAPNYNGLYSLLLACWINHFKVSLTYRLPMRPPNTLDPAPGPLKIVAIDALNVTS